MNPNYEILLSRIKKLHADWVDLAQSDQDMANHPRGTSLDMARASTRRMDMEDLERLYDEFSDEPMFPNVPELRIAEDA